MIGHRFGQRHTIADCKRLRHIEPWDHHACIIERMSGPLISNTALWAGCAQSVAALLRDIAAREVLPRWQSMRIDHKADGSLLSEADTAVRQALARRLPTI